jgi:hypothetical protein
MPDPQEYQWEFYDMSSEDAGRNELGETIKDIIAQKRKLTMRWGPLSLSDAALLLSALSASVYLSVSAMDAETGAMRTMTMYVGDRSAPMYNATLGLWQSVSANLIEK